MPAIKHVGIILKQKVAEANQLAQQVTEFLSKRGVKALFPPEHKEVCKRAGGTLCANKEEVVKKSDLIVVLGGDGTFLSVARLMSERSIPILGVNMGQLGFLTEVKKSELFDALESALKGKFEMSERTMLECTLVRGKKTLSKTMVVNDVVVSKSAIARIFDMEVLVDGAQVTKLKADGLIVATPTGSTAYNLAAAGPIIAPDVPAVVISPICPHSLTLRPLVLSDDAEVVIIPGLVGGSAILTLDGQTSFDLKPGDRIEITRFQKHKLKIYHAQERDYFSLLREKLKYGYRD